MAKQLQDGLHTDAGVSASDLTGKEFKFCKRQGDGTIEICGDGERMVGVISEGKPAGYHTSFNTKGNPILKVISASAISVGQQVQSAGGGLAKAGAANAFGHARNNVAAGEYVEVETF